MRIISIIYPYIFGIQSVNIKCLDNIISLEIIKGQIAYHIKLIADFNGTILLGINVSALKLKAQETSHYDAVDIVT